MATFLFATRKVHRWLSYLLFIQVAFWITGGLAFALIPFDRIIKSGDYVSPPANPTINSKDLLAVTKQLGSNSKITLEGVHSSSSGEARRAKTALRLSALNGGITVSH